VLKHELVYESGSCPGGLTKWRDDYNMIHHHSGLGMLTPQELLAQQAESLQKQVTC